jgi:hypothetical protein
MQKTKRVSAKKPIKTKQSQRGVANMSLKYAISIIVVVCAIIIGILAAIGPKLGLQTPPIEEKALTNIERMHFLAGGEQIAAFKATSYYNYKSGIVVTNQRIFAYHLNIQSTSIPFNKITMVLVKDTEFGHQEVVVSAQAEGVIMLELTKSDVEKLIPMLHVPANIVKHYSKKEVEAVKDGKGEPTATPVPAPAQ